MLNIPPRSEVDPKYTWNAESVFATPDVWKQAYDQASADLPAALTRYQGHLADSPQALADWFDALGEMYHRVGHILFYALMSQSCETTSPEANAMAGQASGLMGKFQAAASFAEPELLALGEPTLREWIKNEPRLFYLEHYVDDLFRRQQHVRSAEVEELLGMVQEPFYQIDNTTEQLVSAEIPFRKAKSSAGEEVGVGQGNFMALYNSPDRELRRTAWESFADGYLAHKSTLASNYTASVKRDIFLARARRFDTALEASLFQGSIPVEVFYNLVNTFKKNIPTWHRYWAVRRKALGVDKLYPYDIWAPIAKNKQSVSYEQAIDWISEGLKPLGDEYVRVLRQGALQDRWIDVKPNQGKRQGAFSFGWQGTYPFIMTSFHDDLESMSTVAHELGHSMHSYFDWKTQPFVYADYSLFVAEVASNFNQAMVRAYLRNAQPDPDFQIALISEAMSNFHRYFFIMPTLARFELEIHTRIEQGKGVTAQDMISLMADLFGEGYGSEMSYDRDQVGITWAEFGHLFSNYYVFQYATGISAAHALAAPILAGKPGAAEDYVKFLSAGGSLYPLDALKLAGVDMTTPAAVEAAFGVLGDMVDRLEKLIG
ncbi:MAG TPA: oligoendopeptidase F [Phototrophicaceae bacterium]|nr:oligoendopeptidase F [Phototrophicaceae bacterium]